MNNANNKHIPPLRNDFFTSFLFTTVINRNNAISPTKIALTTNICNSSI